MHKRFDRMNRQTKVCTGVRFTEEMKGHVSFGERDYESGAREGQETGTRLMFHLTIEVEDLNRFASDARREAIASGWVRCEALGGRLPVERGLFNLLVDETGSARKRMLYRLFFRDGVGHPLTLTGTKVVGAGSGLRPWRDTTTLYSRVVRGHVGEGDDATAEIVASGILRLRPSGLLRQLATFRADGDPTKAYIAAVGRFDALFLVPGSGRSTAGATSQPETLLQTPRRACVGSSDGGGRGEANWRQHGGVRHEDAAGRHAGGLRLRHPHRRRPGVGLLRMARGSDGPVRAARDLRRSRGTGAGRGFLRLPEGRRRARRGKQDLRDDLALRVQQVVLRAWQPGRGADRRVVYLPGSHDAEVWSNEEIRTTLRERGLVDEFVLSYAARFELVSDRLVYCEHGKQFDPANIITDYDDPLDTPFGDHLVTDVVRRISPVGRIGRDLDMRDIGMVYPLVTIPEWVAGRVFYDLLGRVAT